MPSLDDLKKRISSVKSTQKITKAMKMVAAAKLRRAQESAEKGRPFSEKMNNIILNLSKSIADKDNASKFLVGTGKDNIHLCVVITADRGLCGGFNTNICRKAKMYFEKNAIEAVCLRIASCAPVNTARSLSSWLSYNDLIKLVIKSIDTPYTGYTIIYGISNNDRKNVDNSNASHIGYIPEDNAEIFAEEILQKDLTEELNDKGNQCHGGAFVSTDLGVSPMKKMKIIHDPKIKK